MPDGRSNSHRLPGSTQESEGFCSGIVMLHLQILQEEKYLTSAFGAEYLEYRHQVYRYLGRRNKGDTDR